MNTVGPHHPLFEDQDFVRKIEETIRALRKEGPPRISPKRALTMLSLIASSVVALGGAVAWGFNVYTEYGWVTQKEFAKVHADDGTTYEGRADYLADRAQRDARNDRQDDQIKQAQGTSNEILAFVKIVPQIKVMIRIRCMGNNDVQPTIEGLKREFRSLTGTDYVEPRCDDPEIRVLRP